MFLVGSGGFDEFGVLGYAVLACTLVCGLVISGGFAG